MILDTTLASKLGRILLVPPTEADDKHVGIIRSLPETRQYLRFFPPHFSAADAAARRIAREPNKSLVDIHIHTHNGDFVGTTGYFGVDPTSGNSCEVGILIAPAYMRGGYATEALHTLLEYIFEKRGFHRAELQTRSDNAPMRGWLESAGATLEGIRRGVWTDPDTGEFSDLCVYGILDEEWLETVKGRLEERLKRLEDRI
ncbi:Ribosomal-protein-alanine acetyltransferase [Mycena indigotica]|uniref:Ribosomal-protein-alanine acetyltransferase n=1 Tax=Mycena indigotica TaxID=2126181 RepID=A0A8H6SND5_9AGAR|nr:Ribosomal-protein-alanine acetyltransferase [Mycena indigotica]KAF7302213.1 Ribosomal-protein-alanine acetyltransferase [Mycena indigotica]